MRLSRLVPVAAVALLLSGCAAEQDVAAQAAQPAQAAGRPDLPDGFRWESYRDQQIAVPRSWSREFGSHDLDNPCRRDAPDRRAVLRPSTIGGGPACVGDGDVPTNRKKLVRYAGRFVSFGGPFGEVVAGTDGDRTTVMSENVVVLVQAPAKLRGEILATLHTFETDANGCAASDRVSNRPGIRPRPAVDVARLTGVRSVSACLYPVRYGRDKVVGPQLKGSLRLTGRAARRAVEAIAVAGPAGGQDRAAYCARGYRYGREMVVLHVRSDQGRSRLHIRFSGCVRNGIDDGVRVRRLTRPAVQPFLAGANAIQGFNGGPGTSKTEALIPERFYEQWKKDHPRA